MRERIARLRETNVYKRSAWAWHWWGWIEDHIGRLLFTVVVFSLLLTLLQFIWGHFLSDWPQYAVYLTTLNTLGIAGLFVLILVTRPQANLVGAATVVEDISSPRRVSTIIPVVIEWMGLPWKNRGGHAFPFCREHQDTPLMFDAGDRDRRDTRDDIPHPAFPSTMLLRPFCVEGEDGHYVEFKGRAVITAADLQDAQREADRKLTVEFRRLNPS